VVFKVELQGKVPHPPRFLEAANAGFTIKYFFIWHASIFCEVGYHFYKDKVLLVTLRLVFTSFCTGRISFLNYMVRIKEDCALFKEDDR